METGNPQPHQGPRGRGDAAGGHGTRCCIAHRQHVPCPRHPAPSEPSWPKAKTCHNFPYSGASSPPKVESAAQLVRRFREGFIRLAWPRPRRAARSQARRLRDTRPCRCLRLLRGSCKSYLQLQFLVLFKGQLCSLKPAGACGCRGFPLLCSTRSEWSRQGGFTESPEGLAVDARCCLLVITPPHTARG